MSKWAGTVILLERGAISLELLSRVWEIRGSKFYSGNCNKMFKLPYELGEDEVRKISEVISLLRPLQIPVTLPKGDDEADRMKCFGKNAMPHRIWQTAGVAFIEDAEDGMTPVTISFLYPRKDVRVLVGDEPQGRLLEAARLMAGRPERVYTYETFMATIAQKE